MIENIRERSYQTGKHFLIAVLLQRGYSLEPDFKKGEDVHVTTPNGKKVRIRFRTTMGDMSWLINNFEVDPILYFVLIRTNASPPFNPPDFWIIPSKHMKEIRDNHMKNSSNINGNMNIMPKHVEYFKNKWGLLEII
ncbi:MAG: hypothetical protein K9W43_13990 [Candidatus Thorarchaeota archaeon]|nr:hypothetical protein [Candidatus Thorarchaeota archaeon]